MDQTLKDRLRKRRLMPLDVDIVMKEFYENNRDASESYTSQTSKQEADLMKRIKENVFQLCVLERKNFQGERYYRILQDQIRRDLLDLDMIEYAHRCIHETTVSYKINSCVYFKSADTNVEHTSGTSTAEVINYSKTIFLDK